MMDGRRSWDDGRTDVGSDNESDGDVSGNAYAIPQPAHYLLTTTPLFHHLGGG